MSTNQATMFAIKHTNEQTSTDRHHLIKRHLGQTVLHVTSAVWPDTGGSCSVAADFHHWRKGQRSQTSGSSLDTHHAELHKAVNQSLIVQTHKTSNLSTFIYRHTHFKNTLKPEYFHIHIQWYILKKNPLKPKYYHIHIHTEKHNLNLSTFI